MGGRKIDWEQSRTSTGSLNLLLLDKDFPSQVQSVAELAWLTQEAGIFPESRWTFPKGQ